MKSSTKNNGLSNYPYEGLKSLCLANFTVNLNEMQELLKLENSSDEIKIVINEDIFDLDQLLKMDLFFANSSHDNDYKLHKDSVDEMVEMLLNKANESTNSKFQTACYLLALKFDPLCSIAWEKIEDYLAYKPDYQNLQKIYEVCIRIDDILIDHLQNKLKRNIENQNQPSRYVDDSGNPIDKSFERMILLEQIQEYEEDKSNYTNKLIAVLNNNALGLVNQRKYNEAQELLNQALELQPRNVETLKNSITNYSYQGKDNKQINCFLKLREIFGEGATKDEKRYVALGLAKAYFRRLLPEKELEEIKWLMENFPDHYHYIYNAGRVYYSIGVQSENKSEHSLAVEAYSQSMELYSKFLKFHDENPGWQMNLTQESMGMKKEDFQQFVRDSVSATSSQIVSVEEKIIKLTQEISKREEIIRERQAKDQKAKERSNVKKLMKQSSSHYKKPSNVDASEQVTGQKTVKQQETITKSELEILLKKGQKGAVAYDDSITYEDSYSESDDKVKATKTNTEEENIVGEVAPIIPIAAPSADKQKSTVITKTVPAGYDLMAQLAEARRKKILKEQAEKRAARKQVLAPNQYRKSASAASTEIVKTADDIPAGEKLAFIEPAPKETVNNLPVKTVASLNTTLEVNTNNAQGSSWTVRVATNNPSAEPIATTQTSAAETKGPQIISQTPAPIVTATKDPKITSEMVTIATYAPWLNHQLFTTFSNRDDINIWAPSNFEKQNWIEKTETLLKTINQGR